MTDEAQDRAGVRARLAHALGQIAGHLALVPRPGDHCVTIGTESFTWLDMLLLTEANDPHRYFRAKDSPPPEKT